jgi:spore germination cell wall hydrolase CwlJ-like protein
MSPALAASPREIEVLALTLRGEAGERPPRAIEAVAALIMNRVRAAAAPEGPRHRGQGIEGVCRAPFQFACWNRNHPRHAALRAVPPGDAVLAMCRRIARRAAQGLLPDPTGGATHVHAADTLPLWAIARVPVAEIGGLVFYRLEGP